MSKEWLNNIKISQELKDKIYCDEKNDLWVISWNAVGEALIPPTSDEVCKAIHGDTAFKTFYKNGEFIFSCVLSYAIYNDGEKIILSKMLRDNCTLETFELISRYYKGESK